MNGQQRSTLRPGLEVDIVLKQDQATRRAPEKEVDLEVLTWNIRAYKAYKNAGFVHTDTYERPTSNGIQVFHCMVYKG